MKKIIAMSILCCLSCSQGGLNQVELLVLPQIKISHSGNYQQVDKIAIILEPRKHELLIPIVKNVIRVLGDDWKIQIFHGTENAAFISNSELRSDIENGKIFLSSIGVSNISVPQYSALMVSSYFWENVFGENILLFQTDSILCEGHTKKIEDFLIFDYVGAPYAQNTCFIYKEKDSDFFAISGNETTLEALRNRGAIQISSHSTAVGNGGLSIRKRSKTLYVLKHFKPAGYAFNAQEEDKYYACVAQHPASGMALSSHEKAMEFSTESIFGGAPVGVHKPWLYLKKQDLTTLEINCPSMTNILKPYYKRKSSDIWGV